MALKYPSDFNFKEALKRISGDEQDARVAFRELYDYFAPNIYVSAKKVLRSQEMANDLMQEVFTDLWVRRKQLTHVLDFEGYMIGMTKLGAFKVIQRAVNAERIKQKHLELMEVQGEPIPAEYSEKLDKIVELLPPKQKEIFKLSKIQGLSGKVIADQFQISVNAVHFHVSQAVKFIKERKHDVISVFLIAVAFIQLFTGFGQ